MDTASPHISKPRGASVRGMLILGAFVFLALITASFAVTFFALQDDASYINLAGRQRMLSQKASKEALEYLARPAAKTAAALDQTMGLFDQTLKALLDGGEVATALDGTAPQHLKGTADPALRSLLEETTTTWQSLVQSITEGRAHALARQESLAQMRRQGAVLSSHFEAAIAALTAEGRVAQTVADAAALQALGRQLVVDTLQGPQPAGAAKTHLTKASARFEGELRALRGRLSSSDGDSSRHLAEAETIWSDLRQSLERFAVADAAISTVRAQLWLRSLHTLSSMNTAVARAQRIAEDQLSLTRTVSVVTVFCGLLATLASFVFAVMIGRSLWRLQHAADRISTGEMSEPVPPGGLLEIRELSTSLERMRTSLSEAMQMLAEDEAPAPQFDAFAPQDTTVPPPSGERL